MNVERYRKNLPHLNKNQIFLGDVGVLTEGIFRAGLPVGETITVIHWLESEKGVEFLEKYYRDCIDVAINQHKVGFLFEHCAPWKMSKDMATNKLKMTEEKWHELIRKGIEQSLKIRDEVEHKHKEKDDQCPPILIGVIFGAREGGYKLTIRMTPEEAEAYHYDEVKLAADIPAIDYVTAYTLADPNEAIGFTWAAQKLNLPIAISFIIEKHTGKLQSGYSVKEAIEMVDKATDNGPIYYMINCSHPSWFVNLFDNPDEAWVKRIGGIRANGSSKSHEELDECDSLDNGDPEEFGHLMAEIQKKSRGQVNKFLGCCGSDLRHIQATAMLVCKK